MDREDLEQCESCEGLFEPGKMQSNGEQNFCENCWGAISKEVRQAGIDNLDEYLKNRDLEKDFNNFSSAKWSGITEEEYNELD